MKQYPSTAITRYRRPAFAVMSAEHHASLVGKDTRSVETLETVSPEMRAEMIAAIEAELSDG